MTDPIKLTDEDRPAIEAFKRGERTAIGLTSRLRAYLREKEAEIAALREEVDTQTAAHGTELGKKDAELERLEKEMSQRTHHRDKMTFHWWKLSQEAVAWLRTAREYMDDGPMSEIDAFLAKLDGDQGETFAGCPVIREIEPRAPEMVKMMEEEGESNKLVDAPAPDLALPVRNVKGKIVDRRGMTIKTDVAVGAVNEYGKLKRDCRIHEEATKRLHEENSQLRQRVKALGAELEESQDNLREMKLSCYIDLDVPLDTEAWEVEVRLRPAFIPTDYPHVGE